MRLFWYSIHKFNEGPIPFFSKKGIRKIIGLQKENYGDLLSLYLLKKLTNEKIEWYHPKKEKKCKNYFCIGSILNFCNESSIVWGSGIINRDHHIAPAKFLAVRGPLSRARILEMGMDCPEVYGDPALLLPTIYSPDIPKKYKLGVIPHYTEFGRAKEIFDKTKDIKVVNLFTNNIEYTTDEILKSELVLSSSLHGLIVAHAYGIPAVWIKIADKLFGDDTKFKDYYTSVKMEIPTPVFVREKEKLDFYLKQSFNTSEFLPQPEVVEKLRMGLLEVSPFTATYDKG